MATMRAMAAERFGGLVELREMQLDAPLVGPDYVLIRIAAAGVKPVDAMVRAGGLTGAFPHLLPVIPGWDAAGTVEAVGPAVSSVARGTGCSPTAARTSFRAAPTPSSSRSATLPSRAPAAWI